jgi:hypothetical protein
VRASHHSPWERGWWLVVVLHRSSPGTDRRSPLLATIHNCVMTSDHPLQTLPTLPPLLPLLPLLPAHANCQERRALLPAQPHHTSQEPHHPPLAPTTTDPATATRSCTHVDAFGSHFWMALFQVNNTCYYYY